MFANFSASNVTDSGQLYTCRDHLASKGSAHLFVLYPDCLCEIFSKYSYGSIMSS